MDYRRLVAIIERKKGPPKTIRLHQEESIVLEALVSCFVPRFLSYLIAQKNCFHNRINTQQSTATINSPRPPWTGPKDEPMSVGDTLVFGDPLDFGF